MGFGSHILLRRRQTTHLMLCFDLKHTSNTLVGSVLVLGDVHHVDTRSLTRRLVFFSEARGHTGMNADNLQMRPAAGGLEKVHLRELLEAEPVIGSGSQGTGQFDTVTDDEFFAEANLEEINDRLLEVELRRALLSEVYDHIQGSADNIQVRTLLWRQLVGQALQAAFVLPNPQAVLLYQTSTVAEELLAGVGLSQVEITPLSLPVAIVNPLLIHRYGKLDIGEELQPASSVNIPTVLVMNFDLEITDMTLTEGRRKQTTPGTSSSGSISDVTPTQIGASHRMDTQIDSEIFSGPQTHVFVLDRSPISVTLGWEDKAREDLLGYHVYVDDVQHNANIITGTSYEVMGLAQETEYEFKVIVVYQDGFSPWSNIIVAHVVDVTAPAPPVGLTGLGNWVDMQIELDWDDNTEADLAGYNVYANGARVNTGGLIAESSYSFPAVDGQLYEDIFVTAVDDSPQANESNASNMLSLLVENPIHGPEDYLPELTGVCSAPRYEGVVLDWGDNCGDVATPPTGLKSIPHNEKVTLIWDKPNG